MGENRKHRLHHQQKRMGTSIYLYTPFTSTHREWQELEVPQCALAVWELISGLHRNAKSNIHFAHDEFVLVYRFLSQPFRSSIQFLCKMWTQLYRMFDIDNAGWHGRYDNIYNRHGHNCIDVFLLLRAHAIAFNYVWIHLIGGRDFILILLFSFVSRFHMWFTVIKHSLCYGTYSIRAIFFNSTYSHGRRYFIETKKKNDSTNFVAHRLKYNSMRYSSSKASKPMKIERVRSHFSDLFSHETQLFN